MSPGITAAALGALTGVALACVIAALVHPAPIDLAGAVAELDKRAARRAAGTPPRTRWAARLDRLAGYSARSSSRWWGMPTSDLDILDQTPQRYLTRRLTWAGSATALTLAAAGVAWIGGIGLTTAMVAGAALVAAVAGSIVPAAAVREDATRARQDFRRAIAVYLDLVAQERATGRAPSQALTDAASVADSWVFSRISRTLGWAMRAGHSPWEALSGLAHRMGVAELVDLADILATAADGAAIYTTLLAKASALRAAALAADKADANARSQRLALPVALLLVAFLLVVMYPAMTRLLTG